MKILALIPARKDSKRLPKKNKINFFDNPLFLWSVNIAKKIPEICDILVSTDDKEILKLAKKANILAPWLRPKKLSSSTATSTDMALHALNWYEGQKGKVDGLLLLQPTSPLRTKKTLKKCIKIFKKKNCDSVITVKEVSQNLKNYLIVENKYAKPLLRKKIIKALPKKIYQTDGSIYLIDPKVLKKSDNFYGKKATTVIIKSRAESIDIDTIEDLELAKFYKKKNRI